MSIQFGGRISFVLFLLLASACAPVPAKRAAPHGDQQIAAHAYPPVVHCPLESKNANAQDCFIAQPGDSNKILVATILAADAVYRNGSLLIAADGRIVEIGCDVTTRPEAVSATVLHCPRGIISPGFINPHDHIRFTQDYPSRPSAERFEHRHQWRLGLDGHNKVPYQPATVDEQIAWGELRQLLAGTTAMAGQGGVPGFVRNLEDGALDEGLMRAPAFTTVFPLGDAAGTMLSSGCDYPALVATEQYRDAGSFQAHVAEGVDDNAANEVGCITGRVAGSVDVSIVPSAFVHFVGAQASDAKFVQDNDISIIWSPRSNMSLYGHTANVSLYQTLGVNIALSTDWIYSGSMNSLRELQCAASFSNQYLEARFSDYELWKMVTVNAAKAFALEDEIGSLAAGHFADVVIFDAAGDSNQDPFHRIVTASERDVLLVMRAGEPLLGEPRLVTALAGSGSDCPSLPSALTCGKPIAVCGGATMTSELQAIVEANKASYHLMSCSAVPQREPTCHPSWPGEFDGQRRPGVDDDGDGIANAGDNCPRLFNPLRPADAAQSDYDGDGVGDACDATPFGDN